jgi:hypothetical protein
MHGEALQRQIPICLVFTGTVQRPRRACHQVWTMPIADQDVVHPLASFHRPDCPNSIRPRNQMTRQKSWTAYTLGGSARTHRSPGEPRFKQTVSWGGTMLMLTSVLASSQNMSGFVPQSFLCILASRSLSFGPPFVFAMTVILSSLVKIPPPSRLPLEPVV